MKSEIQQRIVSELRSHPHWANRESINNPNTFFTEAWGEPWDDDTELQPTEVGEDEESGLEYRVYTFVHDVIPGSDGHRRAGVQTIRALCGALDCRFCIAGDPVNHDSDDMEDIADRAAWALKEVILSESFYS